MLEVDGLGFHYPGRGWTFRGVTFAVPTGSVTAVLGPNGRGKTTLVRCAAGLLVPQEGRVVSDGTIGYVPQARGGAFGYLALDMVVMGRARQLGVFSTPGRADRVAALDAMDRIGVAHLHDRPFPLLSGGEQQLVLIARAIASEAPVLVLDEPSTGLDLRNQARVLSLLRKLMIDGMSVLLTTHHPDHALYLADQVVLMRGDGVQTGPAAELLTDRELSALYGVDVRTVTYRRRELEKQAIITGYDDPPVAGDDPEGWS